MLSVEVLGGESEASGSVAVEAPVVGAFLKNVVGVA